MTGEQKKWLDREKQEAKYASLFLVDSSPIRVAWKHALEKDALDYLIMKRPIAILHMFAENSLDEWKNKCNSIEECIEKSVQPTKRLLEKYDVKNQR